jgi:ABC-type transport system involved in cytochrome c biogenesis permease subunit
MEELMFLRMFGGFGQMFDLTALIAFIAYGVVYVLVPVVGYEQYRPTALLTAMYLLVAYGAVSLLQVILQWILLFESRGGAMLGRENAGLHLTMIFTAAKLALFLVSMIVFIAGLRLLRLRARDSEDEVRYRGDNQ